MKMKHSWRPAPSLRSPFLSLSLILWFAAMAFAQNEKKAETPAPPFVKNAPSRAAWTIDYGSDRADAEPRSDSSPVRQKARQVVRVEVRKVDGTRQETTTWSDGGSSETWFYKNWILLSRPDFPDIQVMDRSHLNEAVVKTQPDYAKGDFPNLSWITGEKFAGARTVREHRCNIFQDGSGPEAGGQVNQIEAAIDSTSGLPVQIRNGAVTQVYSYQESPPSPLELPPRFAAALARYQAILNQPYSHSMK